MAELNLNENIEQSDIESLVENKLKNDGATQNPEHNLPADIAGKVAREILNELNNQDSTFVKELKNIVQSIDNAKKEIAAIRPKELTEKELPDAANSLDIIIHTSEEACSSILECAEELMEISEFVPSKLNERLTDISTKLFESSNFDDLNGQRVRKVIKTLKTLEESLKGLLDTYGESYEEVATEVKEEKKTKDEALMNGPQDSGAAASQEEIDAILNSF